MKRLLSGLIIAIFMVTGVAAESPLAPVKTDNPRDTMRSFMTAMDNYRKGLENRDDKLLSEISVAVRCLNLDEVPSLLRKEKGEEAAIFLKEVIDRTIVIDYEKIPEKSDDPGQPFLRWRLRGTEITIQKMEKGDRAGEYLFSSDTVMRAGIFFNKVKPLPYLEGSGQGAGYHAPWLEENIPDWGHRKFFSVYIWQWLGLGGALLAGIVLRYLTSASVYLFRFFLKNEKHKLTLQFVETSLRPAGYIFATLVMLLAVRLLEIEGSALAVISFVLQITLSASAVWLLYRLTAVLSRLLENLASRTESTLDDQLVPILSRTMKFLVVVLGVLLAIQNLGVNVMSVMAGLGIGGLAFALAAKDTVANFFGSLMLLFDSPFEVGDWIVVGNAEGNVEEIGLRSTRIRTFYNSVISIPNSDLMNTRIDNMGRRQYRRLRTTLALDYKTAPEKIEAFLEGIKQVLKANPATRKDNFNVVLNELGTSSLQILVNVFLSVPDSAHELLEKQNILLEILRLAKDMNIDFVYQQQPVYLDKPAARKEEKLLSADEYRSRAAAYGPAGKKARPAGLGIFTPVFQENNKK